MEDTLSPYRSHDCGGIIGIVSEWTKITEIEESVGEPVINQRNCTKFSLPLYKCYLAKRYHRCFQGHLQATVGLSSTTVVSRHSLIEIFMATDSPTVQLAPGVSFFPFGNTEIQKQTIHWIASKQFRYTRLADDFLCLLFLFHPLVSPMISLKIVC